MNTYNNEEITFAVPKTENRKLAENILSKIESFGFKPYNVKYGNGYFIFDHGEDSVIHFRCKGVSKRWLFGMWLHLDGEDKDYPAVQIFAQYDTQIDKFKPSRSSLLVEYKKSDVKEMDDENWWEYYRLKDMLKFMRRHPLMAYEGFCGDYAGFYHGSFLWTFCKGESYVYRKNIWKAIQCAIWVPYTKLKCAIAKRAKCIDSLELHDFEKENPGWSTSYLYEVRIRFTAEATEEQEQKWLSRWFKKEKYGKYGCFDWVVEVQSLTKVGIEGRYTYV